LDEILFMPKLNYSVILPPGSDFYGIGIIGLFLQFYDDFSYQFTQSSNDKATFNAVYLSDEKEGSKKTKAVIGNVYIDENGNLGTDKIDFNTRANKILVYPGKTG